MNSEAKTTKCDKWCVGCEEWTDEVDDYTYNPPLCMKCDAIYDNKTGYCSLDCCLGGGCDQSC